MSITFELNYSGLVADSLFAHIHLGQKNVAGGVMIFFCDNSNPPHSPRSCPARGGTVIGTVTAADVIGPAGQGIAPGEFSKVLEAIRSGVTYVNVHSVQFPPVKFADRSTLLTERMTSVIKLNWKLSASD